VSKSITLCRVRAAQPPPIQMIGPGTLRRRNEPSAGYRIRRGTEKTSRPSSGQIPSPSSHPPLWFKVVPWELSWLHPTPRQYVRCPHRLYTAPPNRQLVKFQSRNADPHGPELLFFGVTFALPRAVCQVSDSDCGRFYIDIGGHCGVSLSRSNPPAFLFKRSRHPS
jgi:hypothetical protein